MIEKERRLSRTWPLPSWFDSCDHQPSTVLSGDTHSHPHSEHISSSLSQLPVSLECYTGPPEDNLALLQLYFRALVTSALRPCWCPVLYAVAVAHINSFIFSQDPKSSVSYIPIPRGRKGACDWAASGLAREEVRARQGQWWVPTLGPVPPLPVLPLGRGKGCPQEYATENLAAGRWGRVGHILEGRRIEVLGG